MRMFLYVLTTALSLTAVVAIPILWTQNQSEMGAIASAGVHQVNPIPIAPRPLSVSALPDRTPEHQDVERARSDAADRPNSGAEHILPGAGPMTVAELAPEELVEPSPPQWLAARAVLGIRERPG
jgi:hypothetical protein